MCLVMGRISFGLSCNFPALLLLLHDLPDPYDVLELVDGPPE
jgi:hypothetical protein